MFDKKTLGMAYGVVYGDALGAVVEKLTALEIKEKYGYVNSLDQRWWKDDLSNEAKLGRRRGNGIFTDDSLMTFALMRVYQKEQRHLDAYDMADEFVKEIAFRPIFVPELNKKTMIIERLFYPEKHIFLRHTLANCDPREGGYGNMVNCGAAMYIAPVGVVNAGQPERAYNEAIAFCSGHQLSYGLEAAGVFAAAVAMAYIPNVTIDEIVDYCIEIAKDGTKQAIKKLVKIARENKDKKDDKQFIIKLFHDAILEFSPMGDDVFRRIEKCGVPSDDYTPSRIKSIEELPIALAYCIINDGDFYASIQDGINSGRDTDSIGVMIGGILGVLHNETIMDSEIVTKINKVNEIDLEKDVEEFVQVAKKIINKDIEQLEKLKKEFR